MKKLIIFSILIVCVQSVIAQKQYKANANKLPIAYVNIDSLLLNYQFAREANEGLVKKQEESRLIINTRARKLQSEMDEFQRKLENNEFKSRERAEEEQKKLLQEQKVLQDLDGKLSKQLTDEQQLISKQLRDKLKEMIVVFNKDKKYEIILSNTANDNILYAALGYDITNELLKLLNEAYSKRQIMYAPQNVESFWGFKFGDNKDYIMDNIREIKGYSHAGYDRIDDNIILENVRLFEFEFDTLKMNFYDSEFQKGTIVKIYNTENKKNLNKDIDKLINTLNNNYGNGEKIQKINDYTISKIWKSSSNNRDLVYLTTNNYSTKFGKILTLKIEFNGINAHKILHN